MNNHAPIVADDSLTSGPAGAPAKPSGNPITRWIDNRKLLTKVLVVTALGLVLAAGIGQVAVVQLSAMAAKAADQRGRCPADHRHGRPATRLLSTRIDALADQMQRTEGPEHEAFLADIEAVDEAIATYRANNTITHAEERLLTQFEANWQTYQDVVGGPLLDLARAENWDQYYKLRAPRSRPPRSRSWTR